jgi:hypothetical protein
MTDRTNILQRIINLRELADSSSSEAEAFNAMRVAEKMMAAYRIEEAELALAEGLGEIKVDIVSETSFDVGLKVGRNRHKVQSCLWAIESYCEVEVVIKHRWEKDGVHVIGDKPDVDLFWYLLDLCRDALDREYDRWKKTQQAVGRGAKGSFQIAMADRIAARLRTMRREREVARRDAEAEAAKALNKPAEDIRMAVSNGDYKALSSNMALIVSSAAEQKRKAVDAAYKAAYANTRLGTASGFSYASGGSAAAAGRSAGNSVNFGRPIGGCAQARLQ